MLPSTEYCMSTRAVKFAGMYNLQELAITTV